MRHAILFLPLLAAAGFQEALPESALRPLREATVFIRSGTGTGSGFLLKKDGDIGYVVSNSHVVSTPNSNVTFFPGTEKETTVVGSLAGRDEAWDLAILRVEMKDLPKPLDLAARPAIKETTPVTILGFPFGQALQSGRKLPTATITLGMISSFHRTARGEVEAIQIDGSVDPGNSGGPVVNRSGALVGVTVAKIVGTKISFAIPSSRVEQVLLGRIAYVTLNAGEIKHRRIKLKAAGALIDPLENLKEMALLYASADPSQPAKAEETSAPAAPGMKEAPLTRGAQSTLEAVFEVTSGDVGKDVVYVYQARFTRKDGRVLYTGPREFRAEFSKGEGIKKDADDWLEGGPPGDGKRKPEGGDPKAPPPPPPATELPPAPKPETTGKALLVSEEKIGDWTLKGTALEPEHYGAGEVWSEAGDWVWVLGKGGVVHKVSVPAFIEERRLVVGTKVESLQSSSEGLVLRTYESEPPIVWLVDSSTLEVKARVPVPFTNRLVANPASAQVYVVESGGSVLRGIELPSGRELFKLNGNRIRDHASKAKWHPTAPSLSTWRAMTVTPDGKRLLAMSRSLYRFGLTSGTPELEEAGPSVFPELGELAVSQDSRYAAAACSKKPNEGFPNDGTCIVRIDDLSKPVAMLPSTTRFFSFDRAAGRVYMAELPGVAAAFNPNGDMLAKFQLKSPHVTILKMSVHPAGRKGLLLAPDRYSWFEMAR